MHCGAGIGRAGTLAAGLLMTLGLGEQEALDVVAKHRPMGGPEAGAQREVLRALGEV
jgi:protein-tyrosine phosphatase